MRDSMENIAVQKQVVRRQVEYEYQQQALADSLAFVRQQELDEFAHQAELAKEANLRYTLITGFVIILIFTGIYLRVRFIKRQAEREALLQEIKLLKVEAVIKTASDETVKNQLVLDKEKIEAAINNSLNPSDWNILNVLFNNPAIGNNELADQVSLSVAGVRSSLQKMYRYFYIEKSSNQRFLLVMEATKLSKDAITPQNS